MSSVVFKDVLAKDAEREQVRQQRDDAPLPGDSHTKRHFDEQHSPIVNVK